eukprot:m.86093 g.86093  ORF g.86093 m.86093 type:complete len:661 (+) comp14764_c0_seq1:126-2108(+)
MAASSTPPRRGSNRRTPLRPDQIETKAFVEAERSVREDILDLQRKHADILKAENSTLKDENTRLVNVINRLERQIGELNLRQELAHSSREEVKDLANQRARAVEDAHALRDQLSAAQADNRELKRQVRELDKQNKQLRTMIDSHLVDPDTSLKGLPNSPNRHGVSNLQARVKTMERATESEYRRQIADLKASLSQAREQTERWQRDYEVAKAETGQTEAALSTARKQLHARELELSRRPATASSLRGQPLLRDDTASKAQMQRLESRNTELRQDLEHARQRADEYRQSLMDAESETARLRQQLLEAQHLASALGTSNVNERGPESDTSRVARLARELELAAQTERELRQQSQTLREDLERERRRAEAEIASADRAHDELNRTRQQLSAVQLELTKPKAFTPRVSSPLASRFKSTARSPRYGSEDDLASDELQAKVASLESERDRLRDKLTRTVDTATANRDQLQALQEHHDDLEDLLRLTKPQEIAEHLRHLKTKYNAEMADSLVVDDDVFTHAAFRPTSIDDVYDRLRDLEQACQSHDQKRNLALHQVAASLPTTIASEDEKDTILDRLESLAPPSSSLQRTVNSLVDELVLVEQELQHAEKKRKEAEGDLHALLAKQGKKSERMRLKADHTVYDILLERLDHLEYAAARKTRSARPLI